MAKVAVIVGLNKNFFPFFQVLWSENCEKIEKSENAHFSFLFL